MAQWYYANDDREHGPIDESEFPALVRSGVVRADTLVWTDRMQDWERADRHVEGLAPGGPPPIHREGTTAGDYTRQIGMADAVREAFRRYFDFSGRSNRGEFWWFYLASLLISFVLGLIDVALFGEVGQTYGVLVNIWGLIAFIPSIALGARRLHDIGRTGWWQLLMLIPLVGWIVLVVWWAQKPDNGPNRFG